MLDGIWHAYVGGRWPVGYMQFGGFDRMRDGETVLVRLTVRKPLGAYIPTVTSELVPEPPFVIEP